MTTRYNTSIYHNIIGFFNGLKNKLTWFNLYRKTYSNYLDIILNDFQKNYPIKGILRNNEIKILNSKLGHILAEKY